jgi:hypothetical protein
MSRNYLKAVFWDYPELCEPEAVEEAIRNAREKPNTVALQWLMARFLERGRVRDTVLLFRPKEVRDMLKDLRISPRAKHRWERLLQVYGHRS